MVLPPNEPNGFGKDWNVDLIFIKGGLGVELMDAQVTENSSHKKLLNVNM